MLDRMDCSCHWFSMHKDVFEVNTFDAVPVLFGVGTVSKVRIRVNVTVRVRF